VVKNGVVPLFYTHLIVTSNYAIEDLFRKKGEMMIKALQRRFTVTYFGDGDGDGHRDIIPSNDATLGLSEFE